MSAGNSLGAMREPTTPDMRTPGGNRASADQTREDAAIIAPASFCGSSDAARKAFEAWRALLAFRDYTLSRTDAADGAVRYHAGRWGLCQELSDLDAVAAFARKAGAV